MTICKSETGRLLVGNPAPSHSEPTREEVMGMARQQPS